MSKDTMSTTVKNIKKSEYPIPEDTIELCKKLGVFKYLPTTVPRDVSFELHNTTTEMANSLRRCIHSELEVLVMDFEPKDFDSNDSFIILHELRKRITYIPIRQIFGVTFNVNVHNKTDEIIPVYSSSIIESGFKKDKKKKDENPDDKKIRKDKQNNVKKHKEKMFSETIILTYLRPGKSLVINNIHTFSGVSYKQNAAFSIPGKIKYKCLDLPDQYTGAVEEKEDVVIKPSSSMTTALMSYSIRVPRQKYIDPVHIVKMALKTLEDKFDKIHRIVKDANENFYSSDMEINYLKDRASFKIFGETYTIGNLLSRYGFMADKTITNIHCIKLHPSFNYIIIEIHHSSPQKIMLLSIDLIKKELKAIGSAF
jgi:DNA-directed RNA polymerase subunit L